MRFQTKLFAAFALFMTAFIGFLLAYSLKVQKELVSDIESEMQDIVKTVHFSSQQFSGGQGGDNETLTRFIEEAKKNKSVKEVSVISSQSQVVASSNPTKIGKSKTLSGKEIIVREEFGTRDSSSNHTRYEVNIPIMRGRNVIGLIETSITVKDFRRLLQAQTIRTLLITSLALIGVFITLWFVLFRLGKPLRQLTQAAERVSAGDLSVHLTRNTQDEVGRLTESFNAMTGELRKQKDLEGRLRDMERRSILAETAATLSHEIRNPLNLINLTADHIGHQYLPATETDRAAFLELINNLKSQVRQLNRMVNNFLAIGKPMKLRKASLRLEDLIGEVETLVKQALVQKGISLRRAYIPEFTLHADPEQLRLLFLNLFLNAVEAIEKTGEILVQAESKENKAVLRVLDTGRGVSVEALPHIFEPYYSNRPGGTGLGLTLCLRIAEEHGGSLEATNRPEGGMCFTLTLPNEET